MNEKEWLLKVLKEESIDRPLFAHSIENLKTMTDYAKKGKYI